MDLTDLKQKTRAATLSYSEAQTLLQLHNFKCELNRQPTLSEDYESLCGNLEKIYPDVSFEIAGYRVSAELREGVGGTLIEKIGLVSGDIPHLKTTVAYGADDSIRLFFRADRIGVIKEEESYNFFEHDLDLDEVKRQCHDRENEIEEYLCDYFRDEINEEMEDPFFNPDGDACDLYFEKGSEAELNRLIKLFILTEPGIEKVGDREVCLCAATGEDDPYLMTDDYFYGSERLERLAGIALAENRPVGWSWEYNDGAIDRRSGYNHSAECLRWGIDEILEQSPARERMAARRELREYLEARGYNPAGFDAMAQATGEGEA